MTHLLEQARTLAQQRDWTKLNPLIGQWLWETPLENRVQEASVWLNLALLILEWGDFHERWDSVKWFPVFGERAIAPLMELLVDEEEESELRWFAGRALAEFKHPDVLEALVDLLTHTESEELQIMAAQCLANFGAAAVTALTAQLSEAATRLLVLRSLATIDSPQILPALLESALDPDPLVRTTALEAISRFHTPEVIPILIDNLDDPAPSVRMAAVVALGLRAELIGHEQAVKLLHERLWDFNLSVCQQAALSLARLKTKQAVSSLLTALLALHTPEPLKISLIQALGWIGSSEALQALQQTLTLPLTEAELQELVRTLGQQTQNPVEAVATLTALLQQPQPINIRVAIAHSLGQLKHQQAFEPLVTLLGDSDERVQCHAFSALKHSHSSRAF